MNPTVACGARRLLRDLAERVGHADEAAECNPRALATASIPDTASHHRLHLGLGDAVPVNVRKARFRVEGVTRGNPIQSGIAGVADHQGVGRGEYLRAETSGAPIREQVNDSLLERRQVHLDNVPDGVEVHAMIGAAEHHIARACRHEPLEHPRLAGARGH